MYYLSYRLKGPEKMGMRWSIKIDHRITILPEILGLRWRHPRPTTSRRPELDQ